MQRRRETGLSQQALKPPLSQSSSRTTSLFPGVVGLSPLKKRPSSSSSSAALPGRARGTTAWGVYGILWCLVLGSILLVGSGGYWVIVRSKSASNPPSGRLGISSSSRRDVQKAKRRGGPIGRDAHYHIVFSTGCSTYQDWQSYVFFYQAMIIQQPGTVTRIVSGCQDHDQATLQQIFTEQIQPMAPDRFKIHFTPDYSKVHNNKSASFVYFNKPFGMRHWLEHALGFPDQPLDEDAIVILLDPDQLIIRPFQNNDFSQNMEWKHLKYNETPRTSIQHGQPMGQLYGFGLQWKQKIDMSRLLPPGHGSPVTNMSNEEARRGYIVGPPYIATARDMYRIVTRWCDFAVPVHQQYPHLLAEMFAYCLAAAHLQLSHQTAASFMVSDIGSGHGEGWSLIHRLTPEQVCRPTPPERLPYVVHFCQRYGLGPYFFGKRKLPHNFLSCEAPLLEEPPVDLLSRYNITYFPGGQIKRWTPDEALEHAFMVCQLIPGVNRAVRYFKQKHCAPGLANFNTTLLYH